MTSSAGNGRIARTLLRDLALVQIQHVSKVRYGSAQGLVSRVYREVERDFGVLAPPIALHAPAPEVTAAAWMTLREPMLAPGYAGRLAKEAVATGVSLGNTCPYCITMHSSTVRTLAHTGDGKLLAADRIDEVADPAVRAVAAWARAGATRQSAERRESPFPVEQGPELVGVAVSLQYLNRMVNIFLGGVPLPPFAPKIMLGPVTRVLGALIKMGNGRAADQGASLDLLPDAPLPDGLDWAAGNPSIAGAFARAHAALERAAQQYVPDQVRELVLAEAAGWDGQPKPLSRSWVEDAASGLPTGDRAAGRLALLTAFASYQVDKGVIEEFRAAQKDDSALISLTAWAAMTAALRVGGWMRYDDQRPQAPTLSEAHADQATSEN